MSIIPDCRSNEAYNQKYLNDTNAEFVAGYDWARIFAVENFFDNIDIYVDQLENMEAETEEEQALLDYLEKHQEAADNAMSALLDTIKECICDYIERQRDELITSMIDNMDEKEFKDRKAKTDAGEIHNCLAEYNFEKEDQENWLEE